MELHCLVLFYCFVKSALTPNGIWLFPGIMRHTVFLLSWLIFFINENFALVSVRHFLSAAGSLFILLDPWC